MKQQKRTLKSSSIQLWETAAGYHLVTKRYLCLKLFCEDGEEVSNASSKKRTPFDNVDVNCSMKRIFSAVAVLIYTVFTYKKMTSSIYFLCGLTHLHVIVNLLNRLYQSIYKRKTGIQPQSSSDTSNEEYDPPPSTTMSEQWEQSGRDALKKQLSEGTITIDQYTERLVQNLVWAPIFPFVFL